MRKLDQNEIQQVAGGSLIDWVVETLRDYFDGSTREERDKERQETGGDV